MFRLVCVKYRYCFWPRALCYGTRILFFQRWNICKLFFTPIPRMLYYWGLPSETSRALTSDGFVRTGDAGYYTEGDGHVYFVDRLVK